MPKVDPTTGVTVMTAFEYWQQEAEKEGKGRTGGDLMIEFIQSFDQDCRDSQAAQLKYWQDNLTELRDLIWRDCFIGESEYPESCALDDRDCRYCGGWEDYRMPVAILSIELDSSSHSLRSSSSVCQGIALDDEGKVYTFTLSTWSDGGSRDEPPDEGIEFEWAEEIK